MNDFALTDRETLIARSELVGYAVQALKTDPVLTCDNDDERHLLASKLMFCRWQNVGRISQERRMNAARRGVGGWWK